MIPSSVLVAVLLFIIFPTLTDALFPGGVFKHTQNLNDTVFIPTFSKGSYSALEVLLGASSNFIKLGQQKVSYGAILTSILSGSDLVL